MATTTIWNIAQLERHTADGIVFTAHYTVDANDGTYSAGAYGSIGLEAPEGNVIPYADLTPEIVIGWVQDKLNVEEIESRPASTARSAAHTYHCCWCAVVVKAKTGTASLQHQPGKPKLTRQGNGARASQAMAGSSVAARVSR
jgi:hypothetical protein